jgi:hypothetical protein
MRIVLAVAGAAALAFAAWSGLPTTGDVKQRGINPTNTMATSTNLPTQQFDAF